MFDGKEVWKDFKWGLAGGVAGQVVKAVKGGNQLQKTLGGAKGNNGMYRAKARMGKIDKAANIAEGVASNVAPGVVDGLENASEGNVTHMDFGKLNGTWMLSVRGQIVRNCDMNVQKTDCYRGASDTERESTK